MIPSNTVGGDNNTVAPTESAGLLLLTLACTLGERDR